MSVDLTLKTQDILENIVAIDAKISWLVIVRAEFLRRFAKEYLNYISFKRQQDDLAKERERIAKASNNLPETQESYCA